MDNKKDKQKLYFWYKGENAGAAGILKNRNPCLNPIHRAWWYAGWEEGHKFLEEEREGQSDDVGIGEI